MIERLEARLQGDRPAGVHGYPDPDVPPEGEPRNGSAPEMEEVAAIARAEETDADKVRPAGDSPAEETLPALDELIARIPTEARALIDDLLRAKFTHVRRVPAAALKTGQDGSAV